MFVIETGLPAFTLMSWITVWWMKVFLLKLQYFCCCYIFLLWFQNMAKPLNIVDCVKTAMIHFTVRRHFNLLMLSLCTRVYTSMSDTGTSHFARVCLCARYDTTKCHHFPVRRLLTGLYNESTSWTVYVMLILISVQSVHVRLSATSLMRVSSLCVLKYSITVSELRWWSYALPYHVVIESVNNAYCQVNTQIYQVLWEAPLPFHGSYIRICIYVSIFICLYTYNDLGIGSQWGFDSL